MVRVIEPKELERRRQSRRGRQRSRRGKKPLRILALLLVVAYVSVSLLLPLPAIQAQTTPPLLPGAASLPLPWPPYGQAAVGAVGFGLLAQNGEQKQAPIASMAKVVTALAVLKVKPMQPGGFGETLTITGPDEAAYYAYASQGQSVIRVEAGQELTQYQALQALLLPSANNMADVLVRWAFGSTEEYLAFVNPFVVTLGLTSTHIADASGFSPLTVSTAVDLLKLAEIAINDPLVAEIVAQREAEIPVAGTVYNVNFQLGSGGIIGIKTGNTDQAGGCYMFAARRQISPGQNIVAVGVIMGAPVLSRAISDSLPLLDEVFRQFSVSSPVTNNQVVGKLRQPWGAEASIIVKDSAEVIGWNGQTTRVDFAISELASNVRAGDAVGTLTLEVGNKSYQMPLVAEGNVAKPTVLWRLRHIGGLL